ncbi:MAG: YbhB/YbcL family Raf kinase inhibitor-like protein [Candidatus Aenigmarchaeota archaeon]|nr:YbhB/YbcL family Raf kinase inhibitor-like protein [Candidatus Aenigmarchaeota archaeon]
MKLTSSAFKHNEEIPELHTCEGYNTSPPLEVHDVSKNAASLVLIMDDPDIPDFVKQKLGIQVYDHWTVFNIDPRIKVFKEGISPDQRRI